MTKKFLDHFSAKVLDLVDRLGVNLEDSSDLPRHTQDVAGAFYWAYDLVVVTPEKTYTPFSTPDIVLMHEIIHWTGHASRLARPVCEVMSQFELHPHEIHQEEAVAQIGMGMLAQELGWDRADIIWYVNYYLDRLTLANIEQATKDARIAVDYILEKANMIKESKAA